MARVLCMGSSGAVSVTASPTTKTLLSLTAPANQACAIKRWIVSCEGAAAGDKPALFETGILSTGGTPAAVTERILSGPAVTIQGVCQTWSAEPTWTSNIWGQWYVHLQSGYEKVLQRAEDEWVFFNGIWALRVTNPSGNSTTNIICNVEWEE